MQNMKLKISDYGSLKQLERSNFLDFIWINHVHSCSMDTSLTLSNYG